jgi:hypothetical protein
MAGAAGPRAKHYERGVQFRFKQYGKITKTESLRTELNEGLSNPKLNAVRTPSSLSSLPSAKMSSVFVTSVLFPYCDFTFYEQAELGSRVDPPLFLGTSCGDCYTVLNMATQ